MRIGIALAFAVSFLLGANGAEVSEGLQGNWTLSSGEADGEAIPEARLKDGKLIIKGEQYSVTLAGLGAMTGVQVLDGTKEPKTIDITDGSGANKGKTCLGIYELKGETFRVVFAPSGAPDRRSSPRPPTAGNGCTSGSERIDGCLVERDEESRSI